MIVYDLTTKQPELYDYLLTPTFWASVILADPCALVLFR